MKLVGLKEQFRASAAFLEDKSGAAAIVMGLMTPILLGGLAYASEVGFWELTKRRLQNATDTAALAAGTQVRSGFDTTKITAAALTIASASGYTAGSSGLTVQHPPSTAPNTALGANPNGDASYVYVRLEQSMARRFTKFFSSNSSVTFHTAAIAHVESGRPACILAMHPTASGAVSTGGSTTVSLAGCDIASNSVASDAVTSTGNGSSVTADCVSAVGNVAVNSTYHLTCSAPITQAPVTADPYAYVSAPVMTGCTSTHNLNQFPNQGSGAQRCYTGSAAGVSWNNNITLASNVVYVFENTGSSALNFGASGNGSITGTNVTLYFKGRWNVSFNGNTRISITAPTSGTYAGLAIFGDRQNEVNFDNSGNNAGRMVGAIYSPNRLSDITYTGSSTAHSSGQCTQVIGGRVTFQGNSNFTTNCASSGTKPIMSAQSVKIVG